MRSASVRGERRSQLALGGRRRLEGSRIRRVAYWIMNQMFGFTQTDTARAADVTKQAVCIALGELEMLRDTDRDLDRVLNKIEEVFS